MLSCKEFVKHSHKYTDDQQSMSLVQRISFAMHHMLCIHCRRFIKQYRLLDRTCEFFPKEQISEQNLTKSVEKFHAID